MKTNTIVAGLLVIAFAIAIGGMIATHKQLVTTRHQYEVQQTCDRSHAVQGSDGGLERTCGDLQTQYNLEYICSSTLPDANCIVEVK